MRTWIKLMIKYRKAVIVATILVTIGFLLQLKNLQVIIDPDNTLPQSHPYVVTNNKIETMFGNKFTIVIGMSPKSGDIYQTDFLQKVKNITSRIQQLPAVVKSNINGLAARKSKSIQGTEEGMIVEPLMETAPQDQQGMEKLKKGLASNPVYKNLLFSNDEKTTQIVAEFKKIDGGFQAIEKSVREAIAPDLDETIEVHVGGLPIFLAQLETYSQRMGFLFPIALLIIGLIHYEAFRTFQALFLPLVTALLAVAWSVGFLGLIRQPFDVFNASTPILILAIAAGHAVQILKRYYEEYNFLRASEKNLSDTEIGLKAVESSMTKVGPVMVVACVVAAIGFFSLVIFEIKTIRTFGIFTGVGVLSALVLEMTLIPALRSILPPPGAKEAAREKSESIWDRITERFYILATEKRKQVYIVAAVIITVLSLGGYWLKIDNSQKGYFWGNVPAKVADDHLNAKMAGTNLLYVLIEGGQEDAIKNPDVLRGIESVQRYIEKDQVVGKTTSIVDFIKRMNQAMNGDNPEFYKIPDSSDLVAQYLLLYSNSGEPGDFDSIVDYGYKNASISTFMKTDSSAYVDRFAKDILAFAKTQFGSGITVSIGGGTTGGVALNEVMIKEKILNIVQIMLAVLIVSSLVFRSIFAGILILVPLLAAVFVNFGVMGLLGIPLQIATALVSAMAVGIGADYGIYMSYRLREELRAGGDEADAIRRAFRSAGKASLFVSSAVAGGFGVLMFSWGFMIHLWMGFLIGLAMIVSSISALTIFPSLILSLRPKFIFEERTSPMKANLQTTITLIALILFSITTATTQTWAAELSAVEIMKANFIVSKVQDSESDSTFTLTNASGQSRVRKTTGKTKLVTGSTDNMRVVQFNSPADVKGTTTLLIENSKKDDDIWIYLPAMKKVRRLVSSNKKDSFVGTDFSYGDVIGHKVEDWNHKILGEDKVQGRPCYKIESLPASESIKTNSGYSKRVGCIDKENFVGLSGEIFDQSGQLLKKITAENVKVIDEKNKKYQPMKLTAENVQTGHRTEIVFENFKANIGLDGSYFTTRFLEKQN
jgi:hydrophobe/amphiphile efflux-3 (HAE3) family protein